MRRLPEGAGPIVWGALTLALWAGVAAAWALL